MSKDSSITSPSSVNIKPTSDKPASLLPNIVKDLDQKFLILSKFVQPLLKDGLDRKFNEMIKDIKIVINQCLSSVNKVQVDGNTSANDNTQIKQMLTSLVEDVKSNNSIVKALYEKANQRQTIPTYAQVATSLQSTSAGHLRNPHTKNNIVIKKKDPQNDHLELKQTFRQSLHLEALNLRINKIRSLSNQVLVIECPEKQDCEKINKQINELTNCPLVAEDERKKHPTILLRKVEVDLTDQQIIDFLVAQNLDQDQIQRLQANNVTKPKIVFKRNITQQHMDVVIRVHPSLYPVLISNKRLYVGYMSVKTEPFTLITQCYKCMAYGHTSKFCKAENSICGHCANNHEYKNCPNKNNNDYLKCANCSVENNRYRSEDMASHSATSHICPVRAIMMQKLINRTDYGTN